LRHRINFNADMARGQARRLSFPGHADLADSRRRVPTDAGLARRAADRRLWAPARNVTGIVTAAVSGGRSGGYCPPPPGYSRCTIANTRARYASRVNAAIWRSISASGIPASSSIAATPERLAPRSGKLR